MIAVNYFNENVYVGGKKETDKVFENDRFVVQSENKPWCGLGTEVKFDRLKSVSWGGCLCSGGRFVNIVDKKHNKTTYIYSGSSRDIKNLIKNISNLLENIATKLVESDKAYTFEEFLEMTKK
jgi:hypothetical protein